MGNQVESLKKYLKRLGAGEDLEKVRKDFAVEFQDVDATVIMKAEQEMLAEGTPLSDGTKIMRCPCRIVSWSNPRGKDC